MRIKKLLWMVPILLMATSVYMLGCSKLELGGTEKPNISPRVFFTNVPNDSTHFSYNPPISWYGTDVDGVIEAYYYKLILKDSMTVDPGTYANSITSPDSSWTMVEASQDTIKLYAPENPDSSYEQYIFLTAQDDDSAYAKVKYRLYSRQNHPPNTYLDTEFWRTYYSYPYLTDYYGGINVSWHGVDSLDFPEDQPDFEYYWALFGPFSSPDSIVAESLTVDDIYSAYDSTLNKVVKWESYDSTDGDNWVSDKEVTLYNLRSGYYWFWVMARDDAFVIDSLYTNEEGDTLSAGVLHIIQPYYTSDNEAKDILVVDDSRYRNFPAEMDDKTTARDFYMGIFENLGIDTAKSVGWIDNSSAQKFTGNGGPESDSLPMYKMVMVLNDDWFQELSDSIVSWYKRYLNVGGKIMVTGRNTFCSKPRGSIEYKEKIYYGFEAGDTPLGHFASDYFNLDYAIYPGWNFQTNLDQEMIGAYSDDASFSDVTFDTSKVIEIAKNGSNWWYETNTSYLPAVEYLSRLDESETIFKFMSYEPIGSDFDGWPVAVRYAPTMTVGGQTRTAFMTSYFSFPIYYVQTDEAVELMRTMLEWYGILQ